MQNQDHEEDHYELHAASLLAALTADCHELSSLQHEAHTDSASAATTTGPSSHLDALFFLHHRAFAAACAIACHGAESVFELVVGEQEEQDSRSHGDRSIFQVGAHVTFSPPATFCTCAAYRYQIAKKQEVRSCKHILALHILLCQTTTSTSAAVQVDSVPQPSGSYASVGQRIRRKYISADDYVRLLSGAE